jgi:hypothetical protein
MGEESDAAKVGCEMALRMSVLPEKFHTCEAGIKV